ncbi:MAG: HYR domain-containing protein, partial [Planctomycetes bacterium]|nr:HYR domain-containing protein [Planctomycetota bacterium]
MNTKARRCMALGWALCITAGLLSVPVVAQTTGRSGGGSNGNGQLDPRLLAEKYAQLERDRQAAEPPAPIDWEQKLRAGGFVTPGMLLEKYPDTDGEPPKPELPPSPDEGPPGPLGVAPNDDCSTPTIAALGANAFDNSTATTQASDVLCSTTTFSKTVWFQFTVPADGTYTIDTCASLPTFDSVLAVHTGAACGPYNLVACNDDDTTTGGCSSRSKVILAATTGQVLRIMVGAFSTGAGSTGGVLTISSAAPPAGNDLCSGATILAAAGPFPITGSQTNILTQTVSVDDPNMSCGATTPAIRKNARTVWFQWTPASTCVGTFATCNPTASNYNTIAAVYTGSCGALTEIACNDTSPSGACSSTSQAVVSWLATAGTTYRIVAALSDNRNYSPSTTAATLNYSLNCTTTPPANDACATPTALSGTVPSTVTGTAITTFATIAGTDPVHSCTGTTDSNTVWYSWTPSTSCTATFSTCGSSYDTVVTAYTGGCAAPVQVGCNDDSCGVQSNLTFAATGATPYLIEVSDFNTANGGGSLSFTLTSVIGAPANDTCAAAATLTDNGAASGSTSISPLNTAAATTDASDPTTCNGIGTNSVWYKWTPSQNYFGTVRTCTSTYDTIAAIWTGGCATGTYTTVACNDDSTTAPCASTLQSVVSWTATAGTTYLIEVVKFGTTGGGGTLQLTLLWGPPPPPANDNCAAPTILAAGGPFPITVTESTTAATTEAGDPLQSCTFGGPAQNSKSVWFSWTPTGNCNATFDTCTSTYDTVLTVHTGACGALSEVVCNDDATSGSCSGTLQSSVSWSAIGGTTYRIEATGFGASGGGNLTAHLNCVVPPPANDDCASATIIPGSASGIISYTNTLDTRGATTAATDPLQSCTFGSPGQNSRSVWYSWTPNCNRHVVIDTCTSTYDTVLSVSTGACAALTEVQCNDDGGGTCGGLQSGVAFDATAGTTYLIDITNFGATGAGGTLTLHLTATDVTIPTVTCPPDVSVECTSPSGATVTFSASASDACDASPTVTCVPGSGSTFGFGTTTVNCSATDHSGNSAVPCSFTVTVVDTVPPSIVCPSDISAECDSPSGAVVTFTPLTADTCDASPAINCSPASGSTFGFGTTSVTCFATDAHGNSSGTCSFNVSVADTTAPALSCPASFSDTTPQPGGKIVNYTVTAPDTCDIAPSIVCNPPSGSNFPLGTTTVNCSATDNSGNSATCTFDITIILNVVHCVNVVDPSCSDFFPTIQDAVNASNPGDTVLVGEGTYDPSIVINTRVILFGAQHGVDACTRSTLHETILSEPLGALYVNADGTVIDGFTIRDADGSLGGASLGTGCYTTPTHSGYEIRNNIFTNNTFGL